MPLYELNGIEFNVETFGDGPPFIMLHGFTGSIDAWQGIPERLGERFRVIAADLIGHGRTDAPEDPDRYRIDLAVRDLETLLDRLDIDQAIILGYSMGGRVALHFALAHPGRTSALILESSAPGIGDRQARETRINQDERMARMIEQRGLDAFVRFWESIPLFESQRSLPAAVRARQRALRMRQRPHGLANSLRGMGAGTMQPVGTRLGELEMPVLYVVGEHDEKYLDVGRSMVDAIGGATLVEVPEAGHTVHLEQPDRYLEIVENWIGDVVRLTNTGKVT